MKFKNTIYLFLCIISLGHLSPLFSMKVQSTTDICEPAWQAAYIGDYDQARKKLHHAADLKDLRAIAYLAHSYSYGSLITDVDQKKAQEFQRIVDGQRELQPQYLDLADMVKSKNQEIIDKRFAKLCPPWYQQLTGILPGKGSGLCKIEEVIERCIIDFYENKFSQDKLPFLVEGIRELRSYDLYQSIFKNLYYEKYDVIEQVPGKSACMAWQTKDLKPEKKSMFLSYFLESMHGWAMVHGRQIFLAEMYQKAIRRAYESACRDWSKRKESAKIIDAIFPLLYQVDSSQVIELLNFFWKRLSSDIGSETYQDIYAVALKYTYFNPMLISQYSKLILEDNFTLKSMLKIVLKHPEVIKCLENTPLELKNLIRISCELALTQGKEHNDEPFLLILREGEVHENYQGLIIPTIPAYIKLLKHLDGSLINDLLTTPCQNIRVIAFRALVEFYTSHELNSYDVSDLKILLAHDLSNIFIDSTVLGSYRYFYEVSKQNSSMLCLQCLWERLSCSTDEQEQIFLKKTMQEILTIIFPEKTLPYSFKNLLDTVLDIAIKQPKVPAIMWQFLICASKSGIVEIMDQELLEKLKTKCLVGEETPIKERSQFLNDLLCLEKDKSYNNIAVIIESLSGDIFKEYARTVIVALNPQQTTYEYFCLRRKLLTFHACCQDLQPAPSVFQSMTPMFYTIFNNYATKPVPPGILSYQFVDGSQGYLVGDLIFQYAFRGENYRLYAYDSYDGYSIWASPFTYTTKMPYVVQDDAVYCVNDKGNGIVVLDKGCGAIKKKIILPVQGKMITHIYSTTDKKLYVLYKDVVCIINLQDDEHPFNVLSMQRQSDLARHKFIDDSLILPTEDEKTYLIVDSQGVMHTIELKEVVKSLVRSVDILNVHENVLWYWSGDGRIIALDKSTGTKLYEYTFQGRYCFQFKFSRNFEFLYVLTDKQLVALDLTSIQDGSPRALWATDFNYFGGKIILSEDEKSLYCIAEYAHDWPRDLKRNNGELYLFDTQTGLGEFIYSIGYASSYNILGIQNKKLYVETRGLYGVEFL